MDSWKAAAMTVLVVLVSVAVLKFVGRMFPAVKSVPLVGAAFE